MTSILLSGYQSRRRADNRRRQSLRIAPPSATGVIEAYTQPDNSTLDMADLLIKHWENRQTAAKEQRD
jgi:hypothetical protein